MSSLSLDPIRKSRPDLREASLRIDEWLGTHPHRTFLDTRAIIRDLGDRLTSEEIIEFFRVLRESKIARICYRVIDPQGDFTRSRFLTLEDIPVYDEDRYGQAFKVERANIVQTYEFEG